MYPPVAPQRKSTSVCLVSVSLYLVEGNGVYWSPSAKDAFNRDSFSLDEENSIFPLSGRIWEFAKPRKKLVHTILNADRDGCSVNFPQKALQAHSFLIEERAFCLLR